jgi:hypothetical protein
VLEIQLQYTPNYITAVMPFFAPGIIYIGDYHFMHAFGLALVINLIQTFATGLVTPWLPVWAFLFAAFLYRYFKPVSKLKPSGKFLTFARIRYVSNWALMKGGFKGWRTFGVIYIESSW